MFIKNGVELLEEGYENHVECKRLRYHVFTIRQNNFISAKKFWIK